MTHARTADRSAVTMEVSHNPYRSASPGELYAVLTVTVSGLGPEASAARGAAEVIVIDCSGSMFRPPEKFTAARRAAAAAIGVLREGTRFALVEGHESARVAYPYTGRMAVADEESKEAAAHAAEGLVPIGGTAIGAWLALVRDLLEGHPHTVRHALLVTDGRSEHDEPGALDRVLDGCAGRFTCDARGIGDAWDATELRKITSRLQGTADAVAAYEELEAEFRAMAEKVMGQVLGGLRLRVTPRGGSSVRYLKQVHPVELEPAGREVPDVPGAREYPTRAWGEETREYLLCLAVAPGDRRVDTGGDTGGATHVEVARLELVTDAAAPPHLPPAVPLFVHWTEDRAASEKIDPRVEHYHLHSRLGRAVAAGCEAYDSGDHVTALAEWGKAVRLAHRLGDEKMLGRLAALVEFLDAAAGRVRLRKHIRPVDIQSASVITGHTTQYTGHGPGDPRGRVSCPVCGHRNAAGDRFCMRCGEPLPAGGGGAS